MYQLKQVRENYVSIKTSKRNEKVNVDYGGIVVRVALEL